MEEKEWLKGLVNPKGMTSLSRITEDESDKSRQLSCIINIVCCLYIHRSEIKELSFLLAGVLCVMHLTVHEEHDVINFCSFYDSCRITTDRHQLLKMSLKECSRNRLL